MFKNQQTLSKITKNLVVLLLLSAVYNVSAQTTTATTFKTNRGTYAMEINLNNNVYSAMRAKEGSKQVGVIHFFDDSWQSGNVNKSGGSVNIHGIKGVSLGGWDNPVAQVINAGRIFQVNGETNLNTARIGTWAGNTGSAIFSHKNLNQSSTRNYALRQSNTGTTYINSAPGRHTYFKVGHSSTAMEIQSDSDVRIHKRLVIGDSNPITGTVLTVDGRTYISDDDTSFEKGFSNRSSNNYKEYLLWVEEGIVSKDFAIATINEWPDYVFKKDYKLPSLKDVEKNIKEKGHLHTMPSAKQIEEEGFTVGDMTKRMLRTIEEITLHTIEQEEKINSLTKKVEEQNKLILSLLKKVNKTEKSN